MSLEDINFQVPATDSRGHSATVLLRVTPQMDMQIEIIVASGRFPYRTKGELIRHAIMQHLDWLEKMTDIPGSILPQTKIIVETQAREEQHRVMHQTLDKMVTEVKSLMSSGNSERVPTFLDRINEQIDAIYKKDRYWGSKYREELEKRLSKLSLSPKLRAKLSPTTFSKDNE